MASLFTAADGFATSRAPSTKSCAAGASVRLFNVKIATGPLVFGNLVMLDKLKASINGRLGRIATKMRCV